MAKNKTIADVIGTLGRAARDFKEITKDRAFSVIASFEHGDPRHNLTKMIDGANAIGEGISKLGEGISDYVNSGELRQDLEQIGDKIDEMQDKLGDYAGEFFRADGTVNMERLQDELKNTRQAVKRYGEEGVDAMNALFNGASDVAVKIRDSYRKQIPSRAEMQKGPYAGIGEGIDGHVTRENCDKCLGFYDRVRSNLPSRLTGRADILDHIKAYAVTGKRELLASLREDGNDGAAERVRQYI
ncbi:MAG: hypothetical protein ABIH72_00325 [archaeon]